MRLKQVSNGENTPFGINPKSTNLGNLQTGMIKGGAPDKVHQMPIGYIPV
ncbi:MAG: hypothetical protein CM1200mP10_28340 [Candidatus Neomarinimicrobiota bacterium]|nr:MAG: hypothetical protein CM1200mP10_28340 [Candidatus Neomarinimicrobiota bacterium]